MLHILLKGDFEENLETTLIGDQKSSPNDINYFNLFMRKMIE